MAGSEFTQSAATTQQLQTLATATAVLNEEQNELEVLDVAEDVAAQEVATAQTNLTIANTAVQAMDTAITLAQTAIEETIQAINAVQTAQTVVAQEVINQTPIYAPTNIAVAQLSNGDVQVTWTAPIGGTTPERYAISLSVKGSGWGVASGN